VKDDILSFSEGSLSPRELQSVSIALTPPGDPSNFLFNYPSWIYTISMPSINKTTIDFTWREEALCKGVSTELFFPTRGEIVSKELKQMCLDCPVNNKCLDHALKYEHYGFWAGTSEEQRISIRKKLNIVCNKPEAIYWIDTREEKAKTQANRLDKIRGRGRKAKKKGEYQ